MSKEEILLKELTRLLSHIAPEVEPARDVVDVYRQVDNVVCGLLKERHLIPLAGGSLALVRVYDESEIEEVALGEYQVKSAAAKT